MCITVSNTIITMFIKIINLTFKYPKNDIIKVYKIQIVRR